MFGKAIYLPSEGLVSTTRVNDEAIGLLGIRI